MSRSDPAKDMEVRRSGIGGSDAAAVAGESRWRTPMDVWLEKTGQSAPLVETERMRWGTILEDAVAREWSRRTGRKIKRSSITMRCASAPWRMAHIDRAVVTGADGIRRGLEVKTADVRAADEWGEEGSAQIPVEYLYQVQHYLGVTGWDVWHVAVLIGGNTLRTYEVPRDEEMIADLFAIEDAFWQGSVVPRVAPPIDGSEASRRYLESRHTAPKDEVPMTDALYELALQHASLSDAIKRAEAMRDEVANAIREQMGAGGIAQRDNAKVTWSVSSTRRLDAKRLAEEEPEIHARYSVESEQHRLTITVKELSK